MMDENRLVGSLCALAVQAVITADSPKDTVPVGQPITVPLEEIRLTCYFPPLSRLMKGDMSSGNQAGVF